MSKSYRLEHTRIGDLLVQNGLISEAQLQEALDYSRKSGAKIGQILIELGYIEEEDIARTLAKQRNVPYIPKDQIESLDENLFSQIPEHIARQYLAVVVGKSKASHTLVVAMEDPFNMIAVEDIKRALGRNIVPAITNKELLQEVINRYYSKRQQETMIQEVYENLSDVESLTVKEEGSEEDKINLSELRHMADEAPIVRLVNYIILQAIKDGASDIHIEPQEKVMNVRYRVDGVLTDPTPSPRKLHNAIVSRIKVLCGLDIAQRRLPQDGSFSIRLNEKEVDFRVSTMPTAHGEKVVLRLMDKSSLLRPLGDLGFEQNELDIFTHNITRPYGMILVTGPTGSGKSTTLYSALNHIRSPRVNIVTVEDPVEYTMEGINQVPINTKIGMTFAKALRAILRQDPNTIMIGEIRDAETAEIAIKSALTGHLVFSTIHANNSLGTVSRLTNMGIEPFLIASSMNLVIAQRLVRRLCSVCKEPYTPTAKDFELIGIHKPMNREITLYRAHGCKACRNTGYKGRVGIYEFLNMTPEIKEGITQNLSMHELNKLALRGGFMPLRISGMRKVAKGLTTIEEILSHTLEN